MTFAPNYTPTISFATEETNQVAGRSTVRTVAVDTELSNVSASVNALNTNIKLLQRDDGKVKDLLIEPFMLSEQTRALVSTGGTPRGNWNSNVNYAVSDVVQYASYAYLCHTAHTSAAIFDATKFIGISGDGSAATSATSAANSATSATNSATSATNSATSATSSATSAATNATSATSSATSATNSATSAANSATSATNSATSATNSATSATSSATSAATNATSATSSATSATNSATSAATSATSATNSAISAANSAASAIVVASLFDKRDAFSPAFSKTASGAISVKAGTSVIVAGIMTTWTADTPVIMPSLTGGIDYAVYACSDGTIRADANMSAPPGYTTVNSRKIGGFHYGLVAPGTTVAGGSFATSGNGMIWTQTDVDDIAGINKFSIWDVKFRPACSNPSGMVLVNGSIWVDIYLCSTDTDTNGTSKAGSNIASGTVLPKIPASFGGNGTVTYPSLNWWVANELARANQKRVMRESEFVVAAFGVTENQSIGGPASTYPVTERNAGYTSKFGIEQASGHHNIWGEDSNFYTEVASPVGTIKDLNGNNGAGTGRGQIITFGVAGLTRVALGGGRSEGKMSGSRAAEWNLYPWYSLLGYGLRAACDHLLLL